MDLQGTYFMRLCLLIFTLFISPFTYGTIYKWVDKNGQIHFTDQPVEGATVVKLNDNTRNQVKVVVPKQTSVSSSNTPATAPHTQYHARISYPREEETIRNNEGNIALTVQLTPKPNVEPLFHLFMDGQPQGKAQKKSNFTLLNVDRGEHTFVVHVMAADGEQLTSTPPRKIFLHRAIQHRAR